MNKQTFSPRLAALIGLILIAAALAACTSSASLSGSPWQWTGTVGPATDIFVDEPASYTIEFLSDGSLAIKNDCNSVGGTYTVSGEKLTVVLGASTLAFCGEESLDSQFLESLGKVASYEIDGDQLRLHFADGSAWMEFSR